MRLDNLILIYSLRHSFICSLSLIPQSLSPSLCLSFSPGSFFYSDSGMNNSKWLGKFTWRLNYHLCFSLWCLFSLSTSLAFSTAPFSGVIQSSLFFDPLISFQATSDVSQYVMSSASLSRLFKLWQLQRLVSFPLSSHASLDTHTSTLQTLWNSQEWKINRYKLQTYLFWTRKHCLMSEDCSLTIMWNFNAFKWCITHSFFYFKVLEVKQQEKVNYL